MTPLTPALYNIIRYNIITIYLTITCHYNVITQNLGTAFLSPTQTKMITLHVHQHIFKTLRQDFRRWCSEELQLGAGRLHVPKAEEPPLRAQVWGVQTGCTQLYSAPSITVSMIHTLGELILTYLFSHFTFVSMIILGWRCWERRW